MNRSKNLWLLSGGLAVCLTSALHAQEVVVITHSSNGSWALQQGESVSVNGKDKIRTASAATGTSDTWDSKSIGHLQKTAFDSFAVVRRAPDGRFLAMQDSSQGWEVLVPDGLKSKTSESVASLWNQSTLALKRDKKDKAPAALVTRDVYAILTSQEAASAMAAFVTDVKLQNAPGVEDAQAFRDSVELIPAAIKTFPSGAPAERIREYLRAGMAERIDTWMNGDAAVDTLDQGIALAGASESTFANDSRQAGLRKQIRDARKTLDRRLAILRALDAGKQSDAFLLAYREFEPFDKSFTDLSAARLTHMKLSAASHVEAAQNAGASSDFAAAIRHLRMAQWRDPHSAEAANALEQVRLEVARLSSQQFAEARRGIDPRSPKQVQLQRRLLMVDQYAGDSKLLEAEKALKEAEAVDKDDPKIKFFEAKVAALRGDLGRALALLDLYAGLAVTTQDFDEEEKLRAGVQYKIDNARKESRATLAGLSTDQRFATALETAANGLKLDNEDPEFLFQTGMNACVLRHCDNSAALLRRFLDITDSSDGKREQRMAAMRLLRRINRVQPKVQITWSGQLSWFSGAPLASGAFYDPVSLAFQPRVAHVKGSNHLNVFYEWSGEQLKSVHTKYEDKKTGSNILKLAVAGAAASQGIGSTVNWRTADRETNDFYFNYYDDTPQVLKVSRDNVITRSRKIPISIPGIGGFGGIGAIGGLASGLGGGMGGMMSGLRGAGAIGKGFGGVAGFGGVGGAGAMRALATSRSLGAGGGINPTLESMFHPAGPLTTAAIHADPQGGSTSGYLTLWNSPRLDTELAFAAIGKRVAVAFSGNSFFHPFVWDAIHLFELDYDEQGRVQHAWELDYPAAPRLDFTWEGRRLMQLAAHAEKGGGTVYTRTLQYAGDKLMSETINYSGKTSHIKYKYDKQDRLVEAECDDDHSLDGRSRQIEFIAETAKGGRR